MVKFKNLKIWENFTKYGNKGIWSYKTGGFLIRHIQYFY